MDASSIWQIRRAVVAGLLLESVIALIQVQKCGSAKEHKPTSKSLVWFQISPCTDTVQV